MLGNFSCFFVNCVFSKSTFEKFFYEIPSLSDSFDTDLAQHFVGPGLGLKRLQGYQQMTLVGKGLKGSFTNIISRKKHF